MLGVYCSGISGGHINPAVTLSQCMFRKFPWRKFPVYLIAQTLGGFCAAGVVYANYKSAITMFEGGPDIRTVGLETSTAGIFCTYSADFMTTTGQFFSEFVASTILMFVIFALQDDASIGAGNLTPLGLFFLIFGIGACFGWETGYAINLARDFGPRLMSYFLGYGHEVWSAGNYYFWVCFFPFSFSSFLLPPLQPFLSPLSLASNINCSRLGSHGRSLLRLCIRWLPVRRLHLYQPCQPNQPTLDGIGSTFPAHPSGLVEYEEQVG